MRNLPSTCFVAAMLAMALTTPAYAQMIQTHCVTSAVNPAVQQQIGPPPVGKTWESMWTCRYGSSGSGPIAINLVRSWPTYRHGVCISYEKYPSAKAPLTPHVIMGQKGRCPAPSNTFYVSLNGLSLDEFRSVAALDLPGAIKKKFPSAGKPALWGISKSNSGRAIVVRPETWWAILPFPEYTAKFEPNSDLTFYEVYVWRLPFDTYVIRDVGKAII